MGYLDALIPIRGILKKVGSTYSRMVYRPWLAIEGTGVTMEDDDTYVDPITGQAVGRTKVVITSAAGAVSDLDPQELAATSPGTSEEASRADHVHAHGDQLGGTLHAVAGAAAGFMSAADKTKLDGIASGATNDTAAIAALQAADTAHETRLDTAEADIDALQALTPATLTGSVDLDAAQAWATLTGTGITQAVTTAGYYRAEVVVGAPAHTDDGAVAGQTHMDALTFGVARRSDGASFVTLAAGGTEWAFGPLQVRPIVTSGVVSIEARKSKALGQSGAVITIEVRLEKLPVEAYPGATTVTFDQREAGAGGAVDAATIIAEMVGEAFTGLLGAGIGGDGAGISDDGATGLQLDGAQATLAQGILATAQTYLKRWVNSSKVAYVMEDVGGVANALRQRFYDGAGAGTLSETVTRVAAGVVHTVVGAWTLTAGGAVGIDGTGAMSVGTTSQTGLTAGRAGAATTINGSSISNNSGGAIHQVAGGLCTENGTGWECRMANRIAKMQNLAATEDRIVHEWPAETATTNTTTTTVGGFTPSTSVPEVVEVTTTTRDTSGNSKTWRNTFGVKAPSSVAAFLGSAPSATEVGTGDAAVSSATLAYDVSGGTVRARGTGISGNITWRTTWRRVS